MNEVLAYRLKRIYKTPYWFAVDVKEFGWKFAFSQILRGLDWGKCDCHIKNRFVPSHKHHWFCLKRNACCCCCERACDPPCWENEDDDK